MLLKIFDEILNESQGNIYNLHRFFNFKYYNFSIKYHLAYFLLKNI
jgi:hypothetical protein